MRKLTVFRLRSRKSWYVVAAGALLLTAAFLPQANANFCPPGATCSLFTRFNFNNLPDNTPPPYTSNGPAITTLFNDPAQPFPSGALGVFTGVGTTLNAVPGDPAGGALDARGNTGGTGTNYCFDIGPMNVSGLQQISVSFALRSVGNGGQFDRFSLNWSTNGTTWTNFSNQMITQDGVYHLYTASLNLPAGTTTIYIQFCFTGSTNNNVNNHTYIDNIEIDSVIPEPATVAGGVLGVLGLCWHQRRRLIRSVRFRRT